MKKSSNFYKFQHKKAEYPLLGGRKAEKHKLKFVAANFSGDSGYIWVKYSSEAYDKDGEVTFGSLDILSRWELEKKDNQWVVTSIKEHP